MARLRAWRWWLAALAFISLPMTVLAQTVPDLVVAVDSSGNVLSYGTSAGVTANATVYPLAPLTANAVATVYAGAPGGVSLSGVNGPDGNGQYVATPVALATATPGPTSNTLAAGSAAGSGANVSLVSGAGSTLQRGAVQWTAGTAPSAGAQVVVTFPTTFATPPLVMCFPRTAATAALQLYATSQSATGVTIASGQAPAAGVTYSCEYLVVS